MFFAYRWWLGPCAVVSAAIQISPSSDQLQAFINRFPTDWRLPPWGQYGCGLRIGEVLGLNLNHFLDGGQTYRVKEQVNPEGKIIPCKWRDEGEFRDVPVPKVRAAALPGARGAVPAGQGRIRHSWSEAPSGGPELVLAAFQGCGGGCGSARLHGIAFPPPPVGVSDAGSWDRHHACVAVAWSPADPDDVCDLWAHDAIGGRRCAEGHGRRVPGIWGGGTARASLCCPGNGGGNSRPGEAGGGR